MVEFSGVLGKEGGTRVAKYRLSTRLFWQIESCCPEKIWRVCNRASWQRMRKPAERDRRRNNTWKWRLCRHHSRAACRCGKGRSISSGVAAIQEQANHRPDIRYCCNWNRSE